MRSVTLGAALAFCLSLASGAAAADPSKAAAESEGSPAQGRSRTPVGIATPKKARGIYRPPLPQDQLKGGTVSGAGTRGGSAGACGTRVSVLVPIDHGGFTLEAQPTLYFLLSSDTSCKIELVLNDRRRVPPLVEAAVKTPPRAGLHAIRLADFGISLEPNVDYDWFVQVRRNANDQVPETFAGGQIRRIAPPDGLAADLAKPGAQRAETLGERSIWYDAVAALSAEIDAAPGDAALREQRAGLLEDAGLAEAAASERSASPSAH
jgi:hypothetical protein